MITAPTRDYAGAYTHARVAAASSLFVLSYPSCLTVLLEMAVAAMRPASAVRVPGNKTSTQTSALCARPARALLALRSPRTCLHQFVVAAGAVSASSTFTPAGQARS